MGGKSNRKNKDETVAQISIQFLHLLVKKANDKFK